MFGAELLLELQVLDDVLQVISGILNLQNGTTDRVLVTLSLGLLCMSVILIAVHQKLFLLPEAETFDQSTMSAS